MKNQIEALLTRSGRIMLLSVQGATKHEFALGVPFLQNRPSFKGIRTCILSFAIVKKSVYLRRQQWTKGIFIFFYLLREEFASYQLLS